jgi:hypothetical protein
MKNFPRFFLADLTGVPKYACWVNFFASILPCAGQYDYFDRSPDKYKMSFLDIALSANGNYILFTISIIVFAFQLIYYITQEDKRLFYFGGDTKRDVMVFSAINVLAWIFIFVYAHIDKNFLLDWRIQQIQQGLGKYLTWNEVWEHATEPSTQLIPLILLFFAKSLPAGLCRMIFMRRYLENKGKI